MVFGVESSTPGVPSAAGTNYTDDITHISVSVGSFTAALPGAQPIGEPSATREPRQASGPDALGAAFTSMTRQPVPADSNAASSAVSLASATMLMRLERRVPSARMRT